MPPKTQAPETPKSEGFGLRRKFQWLVTLHRSDGQTFTPTYESYWSPDREDTIDTVLEFCAAEHSVFKGGTISNGQRQFSYHGISAVLQS